MATGADLAFVPWVRRGPAAAVTTVDTLDANMRGAADLDAALSVNGTTPVTLSLQLRGPADVVGIDPNEIVRVDPRPGVTDFEPNYFPSIEFDRPDFPWLFTPARADGRSRLRPWLCLIIVQRLDGVTLHTGVEGRLPVLEIAAPADELPDLAESWAWAHAQVVSGTTSVGDALSGRPELSLSRLLCPRILKADTDYLACVVPTFDIGRRAGIGEAIPDAEVVSASALAPAWSNPPATGIKLPVYYSWTFRTGRGGDFQSLVELLHAEAAPPRLGLRTVDISRPGFAVPGALPDDARIDVESALQPMDRPETPIPWPPEIADPFQQALTEIVNGPSLATDTNNADDPLLAPTLYGQWYAARQVVARETLEWFDQLNLDPRNRVVAAFGTRVVQEHQETLMASAWEQAGDLLRANQRARRLQLSVVVNASLQVRHFARLDKESWLRISMPAFTRIRAASGAAGPLARLAITVRDSRLPLSAASAPMRRIGRHRGPLTRRVVSQGVARLATSTWIGRLNDVATPAVPNVPRITRATFLSVQNQLPASVVLMSPGDVTDSALAATAGRPEFQIFLEGQLVPVTPIGNLPSSADGPVATAFRAAAQAHLALLKPDRTGFQTAPGPLDMGVVQATFLAQTRPQVSIGTIARAAITVGPQATPPTPLALSTPSANEPVVMTIMAAPRFGQPMYESLRDLGQEMLLSGIEGITPNTVLGLRTNRRFVESYMVGLNVEMGRELLWRGFPTDQRGTYFEQFWDNRSADSSRPDIAPLNEWTNRRLGDPQGAPTREQFVLMLRSDLLRRYPTAVIYATPAVVQGGSRGPSFDPEREVPPAFRGTLDPDISFVGFDLSTTDMLAGGNGAGHFIVIQEQATEPRFGLNVGTAVNAGHLRVSDGPPGDIPLGDFEWGRNAAHMARILRQRPVRIAIHSSRFIRA